MLQHHSCVGDQRDSSSSKLWSPVTCSATLKWVDTVSHRRYTLGGKCRWSALVAVFVLLRDDAVVVKTVRFPVRGTKRNFSLSRLHCVPSVVSARVVCVVSCVWKSVCVCVCCWCCCVCCVWCMTYVSMHVVCVVCVACVLVCCLVWRAVLCLACVVCAWCENFKKSFLFFVLNRHPDVQDNPARNETIPCRRLGPKNLLIASPAPHQRRMQIVLTEHLNVFNFERRTPTFVSTIHGATAPRRACPQLLFCHKIPKRPHRTNA